MKRNLALSLVSLLFFAACMSPAHVANNINTSIVPDEFNPEQHIVLVAHMPRLMKPEEPNERVTQQLHDALNDLYPYRYEIVSPKVIFNPQGKYADTSVYRFAILNTLFTDTYGRTPVVRNGPGSAGNGRQMSSGVTVTAIDLQFYDRARNVKYPPTKKGYSFVRPIVETFVNVIMRAQEKKSSHVKS